MKEKPTVRPPKVPRRNLHGVILLDKPLGLSSNDALQKVKRLYRAEKAGHTGTLDPLASGLLPLCFGAATKFSQVSLDADKTYRARIKLGRRTTTGDAEGEVIQDRAIEFTDEQLTQAVASLTGDIDQVPPMFSALKHEGKALYEYAREGIEIKREPRRVRIHRFDILERQASELLVEVSCTKGTYIRTLADDLGEKLGCGAHLSSLRRTAAGPVTLAGAYTLDQLLAMPEAEREALIQPLDVLLGDRPSISLQDADAGRFLSGVRRKGEWPESELVRVYGPNTNAFLGTAQVVAGELIPSRLLSPVEVQSLLLQAYRAHGRASE